MNGEQFVCPLCKGTSMIVIIEIDLSFCLGKRERPKMPSSRSSDEALASKRKRTDVVSPGNDRKIGAIVGGRNGTVTPGKSLSRDDQTKRQKTGIFFHRDPSAVSGIINQNKNLNILFSRIDKFIASYTVVPIGLNRIGSIVHQLVFVDILMIHFKQFNEAKAKYVF
jgi:hypothetical protein